MHVQTSKELFALETSLWRGNSALDLAPGFLETGLLARQFPRYTHWPLKTQRWI